MEVAFHYTCSNLSFDGQLPNEEMNFLDEELM